MPALPENVGTGIVQVRLEQVLANAGAPSMVGMSGKVYFQPVPKLFKHAATNSLFVVDPVVLALGADGIGQVELMATNDADVIPEGWTWTVSFRLDNKYKIRSFSIEVLQGVTANLADMAPLSASGGSYPPGESAYTKSQVDAMVNGHINDPTPHPAYDDIPSLVVLFENGLA